MKIKSILKVHEETLARISFAELAKEKFIQWARSKLKAVTNKGKTQEYIKNDVYKV